MPPVQYDDLVRPDHRGQAVRDHDHRAVFRQGCKCLLDQGLILRVGKSCGFIQNNNGCIFQDGPRQSNSLLFTSGKVCPLRTDHRIHAVRQLFEDVPALRSHKGLLYFLPRCIRPRGTYVFKDARLKQPVVLEHKCHPVHQDMGIRLSYIYPADQDFSGADIPEPRNEARRRSFSAAGRPDKRHRLSRLYAERNMVERRVIRAVIGKAHVVKFHAVVLRCLWAVRDGKGRRIHHLRNTVKRSAGQYHPAGCEHDTGERRGNNGGEYRIKSKVCNKLSKVPVFQGTGCQKQRHRDQEDKCAFRKRKVNGLGNLADTYRVPFRLAAVILDCFLECPERVHCLLENLDDRNSAHILRPGLAHHILRCLVLRHELRVFSSHHGKHRQHGDHRAEQAGSPHAPVKNEHQHDHGEKHGGAPHDVGQVVCKQRLRIGCCPVQPIPQKAGSVGIEEPQGCFHQMCHPLLPDIGSRAEGGKMCTHQSREINGYTCHRKAKSHPAIADDTCSLCPIRGNRNQAAGHQPDTDIRSHSEDHGCR